MYTQCFFKVVAIGLIFCEFARTDIVSNLVAHFPFTGNAIETINGGQSTVVNGATLTADRFGNPNSAYNFVFGNYISVESNSALNIGVNDFTVSAWIRRTGNDGYRRIFSTGDALSCFAGYWLGTEPSNGAMAQYLCQTCGTKGLTSPTDLGLNTWHMVTYVVQHNDAVYLYIDSQSGSSSAIGAACSVASSLPLFYLGARDSAFNDQFLGDIDDLRIYNRALTAADIRQLYIQNQPYGLIAYFSFNGNANDNSGYGHTTVVSGATLVPDRYNLPDRAYHFTASTYISISNSVLLNMGSNGMTFSAWIRPTSLGFSSRLFSRGVFGCGIPGYTFGFGTTSLYYRLRCEPDCVYSDNAVTTPIPINVWSLVTFTIERGVVSKLYINGRLHTTFAAVTTDCDVSNIGILSYIGALDTIGTEQYLGDMDDVRVYNVPLNEAQVYQLYFVEQPTGVVGNYPFTSGSISDVSIYAPATTQTGSASSTYDRYNNVNSAYHFVPGSFLTVGVTRLLEIGPGDLSISVWIKPTVVNAQMRIFSHGGEVCATPGYLLMLASTGKLYFQSFCKVGCVSVSLSSTAVLTAGSWYHIILTFERGVAIRFYINGKLDASTGTTSTCDLSSNAVGYIGNGGVGLFEQFYGDIDDLFIYNTALTSIEIRTLYFSGMPLNALVLYLHMNGDRDDHSNFNHVTQTSGLTAVSDRHGNVNSAFTFSTSKWISVAASPLLDIGLSDFTISAWVRPTTLGTDMCIFCHGFVAGSANPGYQLLLRNFNMFSGYSLCDDLTTDSAVFSNTVVEVNKWYFVTWTVQIGVAQRIYVNGILDSPASAVPPSCYKGSNHISYIGAYSTENVQQFQGEIDEVRVYNKVLSSTGVQSLYYSGTPSSQPSRQPSGQPSRQPTGQPSRQPSIQPSRQPSAQPSSGPSAATEKGLIAYFSFDNNANDVSDSARAVTVTGATLTSDRFGTVNAAYNFAASGHYIQVTNTPPLEIGTGDFSISMWVKRSGGLGQTQRLISHGADTCSVAGFLALFQQPSNQFALTYVCVGGQCRTVASNTIFATLGVWYHVAYSVQRGVIGNLYVNGQLDNTLIAPPACDASNVAVPVYLGSYNTVGSQQFYGTLDDVRIYNRALGVTEIRSLYVLDKSEGLVAYFPFNGNAIDASGSALNTTVTGATLTVDRYGYANSAYMFTANSYIQIAYDSVLEFGTGDFSISAWVMKSSSASGFRSIFRHGTNSGCYMNQYYLGLSSGSITGGFSCTECHETSATAAFIVNEWHLVSLTVQQNVAIKIYVDGVLTGHNPSPGTCDNTDPTSGFFIGALNSAFADQFLGAIDEVRLYNRAITADEVKALMFVSQPSSQPSRQPSGQPSRQPSRQPSSQPSATTDRGLIAYFPFDNNANDASDSARSVTATGAALASDRFGVVNAAYNFAASGHYIQITNTPPLEIGTGDFSISLWVKRGGGLGQNQRLISHGANNCATSGFVVNFQVSSNRLTFMYACGGQCRTVVSNAIFSTLDVWYHFAYSVQRGVIGNLYINGKLDNTLNTPATCDTSNVAAAVYLGAFNTAGFEQFYGTLDDVRVYNRALSVTEIRSLYMLDMSDGLVAYFPFNGNAIDASGSALNTTVSGATLTADRHGNANSAYLFAANSFIQIAYDSILEFGTGDFSISAWVMRSSTNGGINGAIFAHGSLECTNKVYYLIINYQSYVEGGFSCVNCEGRTFGSILSQLNVWHHITLTVARNVAIKVYVDGVLDNTLNNPSNCDASDPSQAFYIGSSGASNLNQFLGAIDDVRVYNRAITADEVKALMFVSQPSSQPSRQPSGQPSEQPSVQPSHQPSDQPVGQPSTQPNSQPSLQPSCQPTTVPTIHTNSPTFAPTQIGLVFYLPCTGSVNDVSGNAHNVISYGGVSFSQDRVGVANRACHFQSSNYMMVTDSGLLGIGTKDFTISAWIRRSSIGSYVRVFTHGGLGCALPGYSMIIDPNNKVNVLLQCPAAGCQAAGGTSTTSILANKWYHIVVTIERNVASKMYINGQLDLTFPTLSDCDISMSYDAYIGTFEVAAQFLGDMDELKIYNRALLLSEILTLFHYEWPSNLIAHFPFNGNPNDVSGYQHAGTAMNGASLIADRYGVAGNAYHFINGLSQKIQITPVGASLQIGTSSFTMSMWIRKDTSTGSNTQFFGHGPGSTCLDKGWIWLWLTANKIYFQYACTPAGGACGVFSITSTRTLSLNVWYMVTIAVERGIAAKMFINGYLDVTATNPLSCDISNAYPNLDVGIKSTGVEQFPGDVDDLRMYNRALTAEEIAVLYRFEQPTAIILNMPMNGNVNDIEGYHTTAVVNAGGGFTSDKNEIASSAYEFAANKRISVSSSTLLDIGINDFTIAAWVKPTVSSNAMRVVSHGSSGYCANPGYFLRVYNNKVQYELSCSTGTNPCVYATGDGNANLLVGTWYHVTLVVARDASSKIYVNGVLDYTGAALAKCDLSNGIEGSIGATSSSGDQFTGSIDSVLVYNYALTSSEVKSLTEYQQPSSQPSTSPVLSRKDNLVTIQLVSLLCNLLFIQPAGLAINPVLNRVDSQLLNPAVNPVGSL